MADQDRIYFARRAAEEQELRRSRADPDVAEAHRKLQRAYLERASVGDRPQASSRSRSAESARLARAAPKVCSSSVCARFARAPARAADSRSLPRS